MKSYILVLLLVAVVLVIECKHTFMGTSLFRPIVYHRNVKYSSSIIGKKVENLKFSLPLSSVRQGRTIQGILAYDLTNSSASANVTQGGIGHNFVNLRMKSEHGKGIHYDVYIYS